MRAVLDVNVLVSAALTRGGVPARVVAAWLSGTFELVVSPSLLDELQRVLGYPKIRRKIGEEEAREVLEVVALWGTLADDPRTDPVEPPDPGDASLVALARAEGAALVTGDKQLLALSGDLPVYAPAAFLRLLEA